MAASLKLANVWRVIKDVDLRAIRESIDARFDFWIVADDPALARRLGALISPGDDESVHPWIATLGPDEVSAGGVEPTVAILVSRHADLSPALARVRHDLAARRVPTVAVIVGDRSGTADVPRRDEAARVAVPRLDEVTRPVVADAVLANMPLDQRTAVARQLPALRLAVMNAVIDDTARANASYALTTGLAEAIPVLTAPLNIGDMIILTKNQLLMSYRIALMSGRDGDPRSLMAEILGVLGGGLLFRQAARQLVGLIPVLGLLPKIAIAYGGTWAIGKAMMLWATEGREVTVDVVRSYSQEGLARGRQVASTMMEKARETPVTHRGRWDRLRQLVPGLGRRE